jgi:hypothetical protein
MMKCNPADPYNFNNVNVVCENDEAYNKLKTSTNDISIPRKLRVSQLLNPKVARKFSQPVINVYTSDMATINQFILTTLIKIRVIISDITNTSLVINLQGNSFCFVSITYKDNDETIFLNNVTSRRVQINNLTNNPSRTYMFTIVPFANEFRGYPYIIYAKTVPP